MVNAINPPTVMEERDRDMKSLNSNDAIKFDTTGKCKRLIEGQSTNRNTKEEKLHLINYYKTKLSNYKEQISYHGEHDADFFKNKLDELENYLGVLTDKLDQEDEIGLDLEQEDEIGLDLEQQLEDEIEKITEEIDDTRKIEIYKRKIEELNQEIKDLDIEYTNLDIELKNTIEKLKKKLKKELEHKFTRKRTHNAHSNETRRRTAPPRKKKRKFGRRTKQINNP
jgi:hypothetical protein